MIIAGFLSMILLIILIGSSDLTKDIILNLLCQLWIDISSIFQKRKK